MNSIILFFPGATSQGRATFEAAGISNLAADARWFDSPRTPTDGTGKFAFWGDPRNPSLNIPAEYDREKQTWQRAPGGKYWVGWFNDRRPDPQSLQRATMIPGRLAMLGDGNLWQLPAITHLPVSFNLDDEGKECFTIRPTWKSVQDRMTWAWNTLEKNHRENVPFDEAECRRYVAEMVAVNYRLSPEMVFALGLIDSDTWMQAFAVTLDYQRLQSLRGEIAARGE